MGRAAAQTVVAVVAVVALVCCAAVAAGVPTRVPLRNAAAAGVSMPVMGLGVGAYGSPNGQFGEYWTDALCATAVEQFLQLGGRRIDTSLKWYHDLPGVGTALAATNVTRSEVFITSKVDGPFGENTTLEHIREINRVLGSASFDLVLMHWPAPIAWDFATGTLNTTAVYVQPCGTPTACRLSTYNGMLRALELGLVKAVGVANFEARHLKEIEDAGLPLPAVVQLEYHVYWHEDAYVKELQSKGIVVNSYSPLGAPDYMKFLPDKWPVLPLDHPVPVAIGKALGVTPAQVMLQWAMHKGIVVNPRSLQAAHMRENLAAMDVTLSEAQVAMLDAIKPPMRNKVCPDPFLLA